MAANFTQQNRFISIQTPLGPDKLLLRSFSGTEAISKVFNFQLELLSEDHNIDISKILGERVTVSINLPENQGGERYFNGFICRFRQLPSISRFARYQAEMVPWLWFLTRTTDCKIFQKQTVPDIIEKVFRKFNFQDFDRELQKSYEPWEYCVQYRETACNFVMRLMETEGIFFYFRHENNRHILVMADTPNAHKPLDPKKITYEFIDGPGYDQDESRIDNWLIDHDLRTGRYAVTDYNFETPSRSLLANVDSRINVGNNHEYELYDFPGGYDNRDEGDKYVRLRMEEEELEHATIQAEGNCRHFTPGYRFELTRHNRRDQNQEYVLTSVIHDASIGGNFPDSTSAEDHHYRNRFTCIPYSVPYRPIKKTPKTIVQGTQTAVVVGPKGEEIYTDKYGRVKVQFHWDRYGTKNEDSSCWIRVAHPWAGKNWGMVAIPRMGHEVVVEFLEGDPDQPLIVGSVYNADMMPPYELPANATQTGIKSRSSKGGSTTNFNEFRFEDKKGSEQVYLHAEKNQDIEVENDETHWVGNDRRKTIDHDETTHVKHDRTETVDNNETITIGVNRTESVGSNETITIGSNRTESVGANETITIASNRTETVGANETITIALTRIRAVGVNEAIAIGAAQEVVVGAAQSITVGAARSVSVGANQDTNIGNSHSVSVGNDQSSTIGDNRTASVGKDDSLTVGKNLTINAGDSITITTGKASISMKKDGTITISGKDITIKGSGEINAKADKDVVIKGKNVLQN